MPNKTFPMLIRMDAVCKTLSWFTYIVIAGIFEGLAQSSPI
jgi:hypothetical protein